MLTELRHRDPLLFWTGAFMLLLLVVATLLSISDTRLVLGINPWIKPMKFMVSITIFLWSVAWFMPETDHRRAVSALDNRAVSAFRRIDHLQLVRWTIAVTMLVEIAMITMQAARGTTSHFNIATTLDVVAFNVMGLAIVLNTLAMVLFATLIRRDTPPSRAGYIWGIRLGVAMFLVASLEGALIIGNNAHAVPGPDGGPGLPLVNWSTDQGDLRVAHFFGLHAMQALPLVGFVFDRARISTAGTLVIAAGIIWFAITGMLLMMALNGRPLVAM